MNYIEIFFKKISEITLIELIILLLIVGGIIFVFNSPHPQTNKITNINFMMIDFALCQTYKADFPKNFIEIINNKDFKSNLINILIKDGRKSIDFKKFVQFDEWNQLFKYQKIGNCRATLHSIGEDGIVNTDDDVIRTIHCSYKC